MSANPPSPGRGGQKHTYLQSLIEQIGEHRGFRAIVEKPVLDGSGSVGVALERDEISVACEISVITEYEVGNLAKCLEAGFTHVVLISSDPKALNRARKGAAKALPDADCARLTFLFPEALPAFLDAIPGPEHTATVGGYRVKVERKAEPAAQRTSRMRAVRDVIARSIRSLDPST